jgi:hypothetical protein
MAKTWKNKGTTAGGGAVYGLGLIGALIYYLQTATSFSQGLLGVVKAILWPGFLIYRIFQLLGM